MKSLILLLLVLLTSCVDTADQKAEPWEIDGPSSEVLATKESPSTELPPEEELPLKEPTEERPPQKPFEKLDPTDPFVIAMNTHGGQFECMSAPEEGSTTISIIGGDESNGLIDLEITRQLLPEISSPFEFQRELLPKKGFLEPITDQLKFESQVHGSFVLETEEVFGFRGVFLGELRDLSGGRVWQMGCWLKNVKPTALYFEDENKCLDKDGNEAMNPPIGIPALRGMKFGECTNFSTVRMDEGFFDYHHVDGINFRGANLNGAEHSFANMLDADFSGAQLERFSFGYAHIEGRINSHTTFIDSHCESDGAVLNCWR